MFGKAKKKAAASCSFNWHWLSSFWEAPPALVEFPVKWETGTNGQCHHRVIGGSDHHRVDSRRHLTHRGVREAPWTRWRLPWALELEEGSATLGAHDWMENLSWAHRKFIPGETRCVNTEREHTTGVFIARDVGGCSGNSEEGAWCGLEGEDLGSQIGWVRTAPSKWRTVFSWSFCFNF